MVYFGKVQNGKIIPGPGVRLVEGSTVRIEPVEMGPVVASSGADPADDLGRFAVRTGIRDLASRHDDYPGGSRP